MANHAIAPNMNGVRGKGTIKSLHDMRMKEAWPVLRAARRSAALTRPAILPPEDQQANQELPETFQSVGSQGTLIMAGRLLLSMFPPHDPWMDMRVAAKIRMDPMVDPAKLQQAEQRLFLRKLAIQAVLESANLTKRKRRRRSGFRARKLAALTQNIVTGDTLEYMQPDYRLRLFRRDQYTTKRDSCGDVLFHTTHEVLDAASLDPETFAASRLSPDLLDKHVGDRMIPVFTLIEWHPQSETWVITQEINENEVATSEETISPYFSSTFDLVAGEDYGRGFVELNYGDLKSLDELGEKELDFAGMASRWLMARDYSSRVSDEDLLLPTGSVIEARVQGGQITDIAPLRMDKLADFSVIRQKSQSIEARLGRSFMMESASQPTGDRVTRFQSQRFALENDMALGGVYTELADDHQLPLMQRAHHQMMKDGTLETIDDETVDMVGITGLEALADDLRLQRVISVVQVAAQLGEAAMAKIDPGVFVDVIARYGRVHEPGLIKSAEVLAAEQQQRLQEQAASAMIEQGVQTAGRIAEEGAIAGRIGA